MSLFITAMTTYFFDDIVYLERVGFFVLLFSFLCLGIDINISIFFYSKLCLLVSTQVSAGLRSVEAPGQQCYRKVVDVMIISAI